ncbi:fibrinogen-like protein 1 [Stomoxys calcitrans]|uniref:fibrinogen-like protein 1 n=1 Tax=Stomoxys calcitrans TaxID=35570 RepID=UPI0027E25762|nr:fibrinogen-like protein 1 [Stomoxys calcitrans]
MEKLNVNVLDLKHRLDTQETMLRTLWNNSRSWTTIQRRQDGSVEFNRSWNEYSNGFGNPNGEYFIGLQRIHDMTTNGPPHELRIILKDFDGHTRYAHYDLFRIGSEAEKYTLVELGKYSGDVGDCFTSHRGRKFTTSDQDNDNNPQRNCGAVFQGGWWFFDTCYSGYLNGPYRARNQAHTWGVSWNTFHGWDHSLKYAEMMIRPKI